MSDFVH